MNDELQEKMNRLNKAVRYLISIEAVSTKSTQKDIASKMGMSATTNINYALNGNEKYLTTGFLSRFNQAFDGIFNKTWLLTGEGEMLNTGANYNNNSKVDAKDEETTKTEETATLVLLLPVSAQGGSLNDFVVSVKESDCEKVVSPIRGVDFAMTVSGDSMSPEYPNGSRVFIKRINEKAFIEWGKVYVLDTCNGTVIKILVPSNKEGYVKCVSINTDPIFAPFDVSLDDIYGIYKVLLCMSVK